LIAQVLAIGDYLCRSALIPSHVACDGMLQNLAY